uniref:Ribosomal protein L14 n=1 Tax=Pelargonium incrassatum TaxID=163034 RepID=A0A0G2T2V9_9ROSI|nr:ribosomal protein L14 [Pelargonium incrassatum]YP_009299568.1 ribosomal protein L14 [Pelargonium incrassatum]AJB99447.1 ribosomal protein L14 [Pelargonium incrassatum]AJB99483.1 ribosomal protein L14 [Pelargonium incrassatum]AKF43056.1 50S ribosomal protein L14 [Pelargonium incrassatum]
MIQSQTLLNVADNSGARKLMCIRIVGASNPRYAHIGDTIVAVIKEAKPTSALKRSEVIKALIVRTCKEFKRDDGIILRYDDNAAIVINKDNNPVGTRIFGAITEELEDTKFRKMKSIASEII